MKKAGNEQEPRFDIVTPTTRAPAKYHGEDLAMIEAQNLVVAEITERRAEALGFEVRVMDEDSIIFRVVAEVRQGAIGASTYQRGA